MRFCYLLNVYYQSSYCMCAKMWSKVYVHTCKRHFPFCILWSKQGDQIGQTFAYGRVFTMGTFWRFGLLSSTVKVVCLFWRKMGLATFWVTCLANSPGANTTAFEFQRRHCNSRSQDWRLANPIKVLRTLQRKKWQCAAQKYVAFFPRYRSRWYIYNWQYYIFSLRPLLKSISDSELASCRLFCVKNRGPVQGAMLWSQFSAIFGDFRQFSSKKLRFSQKTMRWSKFCII
jgi:hypothetical protein